MINLLPHTFNEIICKHTKNDYDRIIVAAVSVILTHPRYKNKTPEEIYQWIRKESLDLFQ